MAKAESPPDVEHRTKVDADGKAVLDAAGRPMVEPIPKVDADGKTPTSRRMG